MLFRRIAVLAASAVSLLAVGASTASAESAALCKVNETPCSAGNTLTHLHMVSSFYEVLTSLANVKCKSGLELIEVLPLGNPQIAHVLSRTMSDCSTGGTACEVKAPGLGLWDIYKSPGIWFYIWLNEEISLKCGAFLNCTYGGEVELTGENASGMSNGMGKANKATLLKLSGALCPEKAFLDASFEPLSAVYGSS